MINHAAINCHRRQRCSC